MTRTIQVPTHVLVRLPLPPNYLAASAEGGPSIDVATLSDEDLNRVADAMRAEFMENALRRRTVVAEPLAGERY